MNIITVVAAAVVVSPFVVMFGIWLRDAVKGY